MEETLFGIPIEEVRRQAKANSLKVDPQSKLGPINPEYGKSVGLLDPCIEGGKKILEDPKVRVIVHDALVGSK